MKGAGFTCGVWPVANGEGGPHFHRNHRVPGTSERPFSRIGPLISGNDPLISSGAKRARFLREARPGASGVGGAAPASPQGRRTAGDHQPSTALIGEDQSIPPTAVEDEQVGPAASARCRLRRKSALKSKGGALVPGDSGGSGAHPRRR
jgi:hypothetical protein